MASKVKKSVEQIASDNPMGILENECPELEEMDINLDELEPETIAAINDTPAAKATPAPKAPANAIKYDLPIILAAMPDTFTPAVLDKAFKLNDGGKTVRRHLRKHFAEAMNHEHKDKWGFAKTSNTDIIEYFASRYPFDATAIAKVQA